MKIKSKIKWLTDLLMTTLLVCLMAYQVTGDMLHEWIGVTTLIVFILHNVLNIKWYAALFKGKYTALRIYRTIVNLGVLASIRIYKGRVRDTCRKCKSYYGRLVYVRSGKFKPRGLYQNY